MQILKAGLHSWISSFDGGIFARKEENKNSVYTLKHLISDSVFSFSVRINCPLVDERRRETLSSGECLAGDWRNAKDIQSVPKKLPTLKLK